MNATAEDENPPNKTILIIDMPPSPYNGNKINNLSNTRRFVMSYNWNDPFYEMCQAINQATVGG